MSRTQAPPEWARFAYAVVAAILVAAITRFPLVIALAFAMSLILAIMSAALWNKLAPWQRACGIGPVVLMLLLPVVLIALAMMSATSGG